MLEKTKAIVLKSIKYSNTSLILRLFTNKFGELTFMAPGARASKSGKGNLLQPGQLLDVDCNYRENRNFQHFKEFKVAYIPENIHRDIRKFSVLTFIVELTANLVNDKEENQPLFDHIYDLIIEIDQQEIPGIFPVRELLSISRIMGFHPSNNFTVVNRYFNMIEGSFQQHNDTGGEVLDDDRSLLVHRLLKGETDLQSKERKEMLETMIDYYRRHVPGFKPLRSVEVLHEVLG